MQNKPSVHVYANGRRFVVVPVVQEPGSEAIEIAPVLDVPLTLGRPTVVRLTNALRAARENSQKSAPPQTLWDGEKGRWWAHHLLCLAICWEKEQISLTAYREASSEPILFPADTPSSELAGRLIKMLGEKLHAG